MSKLSKHNLENIKKKKELGYESGGSACTSLEMVINEALKSCGGGVE